MSSSCGQVFQRCTLMYDHSENVKYATRSASPGFPLSSVSVVTDIPSSFPASGPVLVKGTNEAPY